MADVDSSGYNSRETAPLTGNYYDEFSQETEKFSGCGCFWWFNFRRWRRPRPRACVWLREKAKKVKQLSEVVAGPRWKNFIRSGNKKKTSNFQYDPRSYALNFDDGIDKEEDHGLYLNFSGRYVVPIIKAQP